MAPRLINPKPPPLGFQETTDRNEAWSRNPYTVEVWTPDGLHIERMLHASNRLDLARQAFEDFTAKRPRAYVTLRQRMRALRSSR
jgi:hypothetical protein